MQAQKKLTVDIFLGLHNNDLVTGKEFYKSF